MSVWNQVRLFCTGLDCRHKKGAGEDQTQGREKTRHKEDLGEDQTQNEEGLQEMIGGGKHGRLFIFFFLLCLCCVWDRISLLLRQKLSSWSHPPASVSRGAGMAGTSYYLWLFCLWHIWPSHQKGKALSMTHPSSCGYLQLSPQHSIGSDWHCSFLVKDLKGLENKVGEMMV